MKRRHGKVGKSTLIIFALFTLILFLLESATFHKVKTRYYEEKVAAAKLTSKCFLAIKEAKIKSGLRIDSINDPCLTGVIGDAYSAITLYRRELDEVVWATAPNFSALLVDRLKRGGIKEGESIGICLDGSFPGLAISCLSACAVLKVNPFITLSLSSNSWGANQPHFTYLDMERILREEGLSPFKTNFASLGGEDDAGRGISAFGRELLRLAIERNSIQLLDTGEIPQVKAGLYPQKLTFFINIGQSAAANFLIADMREKRRKILNLSSPKKWLEKRGIKSEDLFSDIGQGRIYVERRYSVGLAILFTALILVAFFLVVRYDFEYYLLPKDKREERNKEVAI